MYRKLYFWSVFPVLAVTLRLISMTFAFLTLDSRLDKPKDAWLRRLKIKKIIIALMTIGLSVLAGCGLTSKPLLTEIDSMSGKLYFRSVFFLSVTLCLIFAHSRLCVGFSPKNC